ncbi:hypothetical protein JW824_09340 [bacterium]|nr:hypothetical protein [bacterium]RQV94296.1 MAG: hypothetical protein EH221_07545 [bacterium]
MMKQMIHKKELLRLSLEESRQRTCLFASFVRAVSGVFEPERRFPGFPSPSPFRYAECMPTPCMGDPINRGKKAKKRYD